MGYVLNRPLPWPFLVEAMSSDATFDELLQQPDLIFGAMTDAGNINTLAHLNNLFDKGQNRRVSPVT
jgi:hypothetical protein